MRLVWTAGLAICAALLLAAPTAHAQAQPSSKAQPSSQAQPPSAEIGSLKLALGLVQQGKGAEAIATSAELRDPVARKLVTWLALRVDWKPVGFDRANAFLRESPDWPGTTGVLRRRAEALLYEEKRDAKTVRAFFNGNKPLSGEGKLALARALVSAGDKIGALPLVQSAWRDDDLNASIETETLAAFPGFLTRDDHKARADRLHYDGNHSGALRAAERGGADLVALERARQATAKRAGNANALINAVPAALRNDPALLLARSEYRRRANDVDGAAKIMLEAPRDPKRLVDPDEWWKEVRALVRALLDKGDAKTAYRVAAHCGEPSHENYKADQQFTAGWVALRFLKDPATALRHFKAIDAMSKHPTTLSRGLYWQGRAAEAMNDRAAAQVAYQRAAVFSTSYYGQLARARVGFKELALNRPVEPSPTERANFSKLEVVRALRLLYAAGATDLTIPFHVDLTERAKDEASILMLASVAYEHRDPRGMVLIGRTAYSRGVLIDSIAFPLFGIPDHPKDEPPVDRSVVYAISRQESQFTQSVVSSANAYGLMQVIVPTARAIAKRLGIAFDRKKLESDPAYNARLGAAELGHLLDSYNGSYILAFVGYNAGPGRAREWIARYGDPRDPKVDPVDWVERVPISETRYYIQRVMENLQVYRVLFGDQRGFRIEADLSRGARN